MMRAPDGNRTIPHYVSDVSFVRNVANEPRPFNARLGCFPAEQENSVILVGWTRDGWGRGAHSLKYDILTVKLKPRVCRCGHNNCVNYICAYSNGMQLILFHGKT